MAIVVLMYGGTYIAVTGSIPVANAISVLQACIYKSVYTGLFLYHYYSIVKFML